jgi:hypothetical protein
MSSSKGNSDPSHTSTHCPHIRWGYSLLLNCYLLRHRSRVFLAAASYLPWAPSTSCSDRRRRIPIESVAILLMRSCVDSAASKSFQAATAIECLLRRSGFQRSLRCELGAGMDNILLDQELVVKCCAGAHLYSIAAFGSHFDIKPLIGAVRPWAPPLLPNEKDGVRHYLSPDRPHSWYPHCQEHRSHSPVCEKILPPSEVGAASRIWRCSLTWSFLIRSSHINLCLLRISERPAGISPVSAPPWIACDRACGLVAPTSARRRFP